MSGPPWMGPAMAATELSSLPLAPSSRARLLRAGFRTLRDVEGVQPMDLSRGEGGAEVCASRPPLQIRCFCSLYCVVQYIQLLIAIVSFEIPSCRSTCDSNIASCMCHSMTSKYRYAFLAYSALCALETQSLGSLGVSSVLGVKPMDPSRGEGRREGGVRAGVAPVYHKPAADSFVGGARLWRLKFPFYKRTAVV